MLYWKRSVNRFVGTTIIMPGEEAPLSSAWEIQDRIGDQLAFILDDGTSVIGDTTVVDLSGDEPEGYP